MASLRDVSTRILITAKDQTAGVFGSIRRNAGKLAAALISVFSFRAFSGAVTAAEDLDVQMRKLRATVQATGGAAGLTAEEIDALARKLDEATLGSAAGFRDAANALLTFKSIGRDSFETVLGLAADLEAAGFGTLETNAIQLGKALEDPIKGLTALTRSGVSFTDEQQKVIRSLVETGRVAEAQGIILDAVAGQVGGVAAAAGGGLSGALDLVSKRFTDIKEQLGNAILPVFQRFNERIAETYKRLSDTGVVKRFGEILATAFDAAQTKIFEFLDSFDLDALLGSLTRFASETKTTLDGWAANLQSVSRVASVAFAAISNGVNTLKTLFFGSAGVVAKFAQGVTGAFANILEAAAKLRPSLRETAEEVRAISDSFGDSARKNFDDAADALDQTAASSERLRDSFGELIGVSTGAANTTGEVAGAAQEAAQQITLSADALDALGEGFEFVDGEARKAAGGIDATATAAKTAAQDLIAAQASANALEESYKLLGVTSQSALDESANEAKTAFERIRDSGEATPAILAKAWEGYANKAIEANGGVASAVIKAQSSMFGLRVEASTTGDTLESKLAGAGSSLRAIGDNAQNAAEQLSLITAEADRATAAIKKMYEASDRPFGGESRFSLARDGTSRSAPGGLGGIGSRLELELRSAATSVGSRK